MPKDEFDFGDPLELNGLAFATPEDTTSEMGECFAEEFMRMGYNARQVLALFRNPEYLGPNLVLQKRGEAFVRGLIAEVFARWGIPVEWPAPLGTAVKPAGPPTERPGGFLRDGDAEGLARPASVADPIKRPAPKLNR